MVTSYVYNKVRCVYSSDSRRLFAAVTASALNPFLLITVTQREFTKLNGNIKT